MILTLILLAFYLLLSLPFIGSPLQHAILHVLLHLFDHHEWTVEAFGIVLWLLLFLSLVFLFMELWWLLADAILLLLICTKLFHTFSRH